MKSKGNKDNRRSGQALIIAVLSLGGAILGATTIAGLLTIYQIRATTDSENSAKSIFAADAGVNLALFDFYCSTDGPGGRCPSVTPDVSDYPGTPFSNGATTTLNCYEAPDASGPTTFCSDPNTEAAISTGVSLGSERAFFLGLYGSTTTYP
jgi:hypothetical protein